VNFILKDENAVYYECGFSCDNVVFLSFGNEAFFITDARYTHEARQYVKNATVIEGDRRDLYKTVREIITNSKVKEIVFNPSEWSVDAYEKLSSELLHVSFEKEQNFSQQKRIIKTREEIEILKTASTLGKEAFDALATYLKQNGLGASEQRLHFEAELIFKKMGELGLSFSPIVALGKNAAKPHALPTADVLSEGELVLVDAGVKYKRYCSDRTRTCEFNSEMDFGKVQNFTDKKKQKVYDTVLFAQEAGIKKARVGVKACDVDKACREVIEKAGFGEFFIHSTGHGVGLDIHELPIIGARSETILEEGMVFTVEPGIYLGDAFGVRIEDTVVMDSNCAQVIGK
jgi:Xaa-Pro aminopeptidase